MKKVLIVDDEELVLDVLQRILLRLGYNTAISTSGDSALANYDKHVFDLVVMDVIMPKINGFQIAREMKRIRPDQKIVMITGMGTSAAKARADFEKVAVNEVLSKPFTFENVKSVLTKVLDA